MYLTQRKNILEQIFIQNLQLYIINKAVNRLTCNILDLLVQG